MVQHQPGFGPPVGPAIGGGRRCGPRTRAIGLVYREGDGRDDDPIPATLKLRIVLLKTLENLKAGPHGILTSLSQQKVFKRPGLEQRGLSSLSSTINTPP